MTQSSRGVQACRFNMAPWSVGRKLQPTATPGGWSGHHTGGVQKRRLSTTSCMARPALRKGGVSSSSVFYSPGGHR